MQNVQPKQHTFTKWIIAVVVGAATGILTVYGKFLPKDWNALADSAALWMIIAFFVAAMGRTPQVCVGLASLLLAVANTVYYPLSAVVNKQPIAFGSAMAVWYAGAICAGLVFGLAAFFWRNKTGLPFYIGNALPAAVLWAESAMMLTTVYYAEHPVAAYIGFAIGFTVLVFACVYAYKKQFAVFAKQNSTVKKERFTSVFLKSVAMGVPITALGVFGYKILWWLLG